MSLRHDALAPVGWSLYFAFIFENVFMGQRHLELICFFQHFKMSFHFVLVSSISDEKAAVLMCLFFSGYFMIFLFLMSF